MSERSAEEYWILKSLDEKKRGEARLLVGKLRFMMYIHILFSHGHTKPAWDRHVYTACVQFLLSPMRARPTIRG